jgi:hypothetical protein
MPFVGFVNNDKQLKAVLLPLPEGPIRQVILEGSTLMLMSFRIAVPFIPLYMFFPCSIMNYLSE